MSEQFPRKLYGRRKGPKLSPHKEELRRTLLPKLALKLEFGADPRSYFLPPPSGEVEARSASGGGITEVWLEIGFGAGEHLLALARANPHIGLIGAEPYEAGVAKLLSKISLSPKGGERQGEGANIRIHEGDARQIIEALPDDCLGCVIILFPDPWPKTRHHKRRFIQMEMLDQFARILKSGAELRFASDDAGYAEWTLERALAHPAFLWSAKGPSDWRARPADWPQTRYETKALHGPPVYLRFTRT